MFHGLYPCKLSDRLPHTLRDRDQLGIGLAATNRATQFHWLKHMIRYRQTEVIHFKLCISEARRQGKAPWGWCSSWCSSTSTNSSVFKAPFLFSLCHPWCVEVAARWQCTSKQLPGRKKRERQRGKNRALPAKPFLLYQEGKSSPGVPPSFHLVIECFGPTPQATSRTAAENALEDAGLLQQQRLPFLPISMGRTLLTG